MGVRDENRLNLNQPKKVFMDDLTPEQAALILKEKAGVFFNNIRSYCRLDQRIQEILAI